MDCVVCGSAMISGKNKWHFYCKNCKHESAQFEDKINDRMINENLDEDLRLNALKTIRQNNFEKIIEILRSSGFNFKKSTALDVGCAHGWFMNELTKAGCKKVVGIEPDKRIYKQFSKNVLHGYFPNVLKKSDKFDLISFNDVFEHIPDSNKVLDDVNKHMYSGGYLVLNLPSSKGTLYRISKVLYTATFPASFRRLWQKGLPSPHVHYYSPKNLRDIAKKHGFKEVYAGRLQVVSKDGLKERIGYSKTDLGVLRKLWNKTNYWLLYSLTPIINKVASDIQLAIFTKE